MAEVGAGSAGMSVQQEQRPIIFLVEADDETRPLLKSNLQRYGYRVTVALDEEDAIERMGGGPPVDLFLLDTVGISLEDALDAGRRIRTSGKYTGRTPLVVMAEKYGADVEGTDVNVGENDWLTYLEDPAQLKNLLARLLNKTSS